MISVFLQLDDFRELKIRRFHSTSMMISNTSYLIKILSPKNWENDIGWAYLQQRKNEVTKGFH